MTNENASQFIIYQGEDGQTLLDVRFAVQQSDGSGGRNQSVLPHNGHFERSEKSSYLNLYGSYSPLLAAGFFI